jgi:hypothetical protein
MTSELISFRTAIVALYPDLENAAFRLLPGGWHSRAVAVDERRVFKFPQGEEAEQALRREASILATIRPHLAMPVPDLHLHEGAPLFRTRNHPRRPFGNRSLRDAAGAGAKGVG